MAEIDSSVFRLAKIYTICVHSAPSQSTFFPAPRQPGRIAGIPPESPDNPVTGAE